MSLKNADVRAHAEGIEEGQAFKMLAECEAVWRGRLPEEAEALWDWLSQQSAATRLDLLAFCAGSSVDAVKKPHDHTTAPRLRHADRLAVSLKLDMAHWWQATASSYLGRVSKARIYEAITEAVSPQAAQNLATIKSKAGLIAEADLRLSGTGWLPSLLRAPSVSNAEQNVALQEAAE